MDPLRKMIAEGEHLQQDFKYCINDSRKIARSLAAFANSNGGRLLLGILGAAAVTALAARFAAADRRPLGATSGR